MARGGLNRRGLTLIEVLVGTLLISMIALSLGRFAGSATRATGSAGARLVATSVAQERLELVRADPRFDAIPATYGGGAGADSTGFPGYPAMRRVTTVVTAAAPRVLHTVTVRVTDPALPGGVALTGVVGRP